MLQGFGGKADLCYLLRDHYEDVPAQVAEKIIAAAKKEKEEEKV